MESGPKGARFTMKLRSLLLALAASTAFAAMPSLASALPSDFDTCSNKAAAPDDLIAACTRLIESGTLSAENLPIAYVARGYGYQEKREYTLAAADDSRSIVLSPKHAVAYLNRGYNYIGLGRYRDAISDETTAIQIGTLTGKALARAYNNRADAHLAIHEYAQAIADATASMRIVPNYATPILVRGEAYMRELRPTQAYTDLSLALRLDPLLSSAFAYRSTVENELSRYPAALADITHAISLAPTDKFYHVLRSYIYFYLGKFALAIPEFRSTIAVDPAYRSLWLYLAQAHLKQNGATELAHNTITLAAAKWPSPIIAFYLGHATRSQVLAAAALGGAKARPSQECETSFYLGEWELLHGKTSAARIDLTHAAKTCPLNFIEHTGAKAELSRMHKPI